MANMALNNVWTLVPHSVAQGKLMTGRWALTEKSSGKIKTRWCARGFSEPFAGDTYVDVMPPAIMPILLALAAWNNLHIRQVDITAAFLDADLDTPIYIEQPYGQELSGNLVCKLNKAIYSLKTAPRRWQQKLRDVLLKIGFKQLKYDPNVFRCSDTIISTYVDEFMILYPSKSHIHDTVTTLKQVFRNKDLGVMVKFLGFTINRKLDGIRINQQDKIEAPCDDLGLLHCTIKQAYSGSARRAMGKGTGQPWWNAEYKAAAQTYRQTRRSTDNQDAIIAAKKALRTVTRHAKRNFFQDKLNQASIAKDVYGIVNWHRSAGSFRTPPLKDPLHPDAPLAVTAESKRQVLVQNLLKRMPESGDIPMETPAVGCRALPFPEITDQEIKEAVFRPGNTAPGEDEIPTSILKIVWDLIKDKVSSLFRSCLEVGHHPTCFKTAVVVMLSKPNKQDKSNLRSYRPISLRSVLGKSLERLVARRLSWIAITHRVIVTQHFGGLPLRSATDLTTCLTYDVETALNSNLTASLPTVDVKSSLTEFSLDGLSIDSGNRVGRTS
ncbi:hypothetical protein K3495_g6027 [Podosphaera aphanis]|nr:hypothetical protein K3495_g6027 [Podosphaera aphanis]